MAKVEYAFPVDKIHGRISKKHKLGFAHRKASLKNYTVTYGVRTTPYTEKETAQKAKFSTVGQAVRARMKDPTKINEDLAAFKAQTEYKTLYRFLWNLEWKKAQ